MAMDREKGEMTITWCVEDIYNMFDHNRTTREQALDILEDAWESHDAEYGITWNLLMDIALDMFPELGKGE